MPATRLINHVALVLFRRRRRRQTVIGTFKQDRITCQHLSMHLIQKKNEMVTWIDAMRSHPFYLAADVLQAALRVRDGPRMRDQ